MILSPFKTKINLQARDYIERCDDPDVSVLPPEYETIVSSVKFDESINAHRDSRAYTSNMKWQFNGLTAPAMQCEVRFKQCKFKLAVFMEMPDHLLDYYIIEQPEPLFGDRFLKSKFGKNSFNPFSFLSVGMGLNYVMYEKESRTLRASVSQYNNTHDAKLTVRRQPGEGDYGSNAYYVFRYQ